jgi:hypothetical protein
MRPRNIVLSLVFLLGVLLGAPSAFGAEAKPAPAPATKATSAARVDLNTASEKELIDLPGIGEANAKKIIQNRPYSSLRDLKKAGLSDATIKKMSGHATVKRSAAAREKKRETIPAKHTERTPRENANTSASRAEPAKTPAAGSSEAAKSGKVWLNTESNIYHRSDSRWFGTTKNGKFVDEAQARKEGARESKE